MKNNIFIDLLIVLTSASWAGDAMEESSVGRSDYLAEQGFISPAEEIHESSFIGKVNYAYSQPEGFSV